MPLAHRELGAITLSAQLGSGSGTVAKLRLLLSRPNTSKSAEHLAFVRVLAWSDNGAFTMAAPA